MIAEAIHEYRLMLKDHDNLYREFKKLLEADDANVLSSEEKQRFEDIIGPEGIYNINGRKLRAKREQIVASLVEVTGVPIKDLEFIIGSRPARMG